MKGILGYDGLQLLYLVIKVIPRYEVICVARRNEIRPLSAVFIYDTIPPILTFRPLSAVFIYDAKPPILTSPL